MYNVYAPAMQGMQAMQNLGDQIGSGFALANLLSSANSQAQYGPASDLQQEQLRQQGQTERLNAILPLLLQSFGGGGGAGGFTTNYGASATYNTNPQAQQSQLSGTPQQQQGQRRIDANQQVRDQQLQQILGGQQQPAPSLGQTHGIQPQAPAPQLGGRPVNQQPPGYVPHIWGNR